jgi:hypothetical protein
MTRLLLLTIVGSFIAVVTTQPGTLFAQDAQAALEQRQMKLPQVGRGEACPISMGTRDTVPRQRHIFGAGGVWFGSGPVYLSLAWKASSDDNASFALAPVPYEKNAYRAKTPWVSVPSYSGPVLIRGHSLDADNRALRFDATGSGPSERLRLQGPHAPSALLWSFWASSMWIPGAGCYGVQIDSLSGTEVVIFEATQN